MATAKESNDNKKSTRKVGETLLVKPVDKKFKDSMFNSLEGLNNQFYSEKTKSYFLEFKDSESASNAFKTLDENDTCIVKFALYKLFFKFDPSCHTDTSDAARSVVVKTGSKLDDLDNLERKVKLDQSSYYLTFKDKKSASKALTQFKENNVEAESTLDYNYIKECHSKLIEERTGRRPMYYKLYLKRGTKEIRGCGELTLGNKTAFDKLLSTEENGLKEYDLGLSGINGKHYIYKRNQRDTVSK